MLLKNTFSCKTVFHESVKSAYEILIVDVSFFEKIIRFILVYRTPSCNAANSTQLSRAISDHSSIDKPALCWVILILRILSGAMKDKLELCLKLSMTCSNQLVLSPTREKSFLDLIFCNIPGLVTNVTVTAPLGSSDHNALEFMVNVKSWLPVVSWKRAFQAADYSAIEGHLLNVDWLGCFAAVSTVDEMYELFITIIHDTIERFVPIKKTGDTFVRLPSYIRRMIGRRNALWSFAIKNGLGNDWSIFKKHNAIVERCINKYHVYLEKKIVGTKSLSKLSRIKNKTSIPALIASNGSVLFSYRDEAELLGQQFRKYFCSSPPYLIENPSQNYTNYLISQN
ncbi:hypothetical protein OSTOST_09900 [Ostertagia ostertagi]